MAYQVPLDQPLTETQAELIAKIGSMKNLMSLDFLKKLKIFKGEQISTFDYCIKIMRSMGIDPAVLLQAFLNIFFETSKLVEFILRGMAQLCTGLGINLDQNSNYTISGNASKEEKKKLTNINFAYLNSNAALKSSLTTVVNGLKMQLIKDLMTLIFGDPKKPSGKAVMTENQDTSYDRLGELVTEIYCGSEIFSVSSPTNTRNEDLEYNRIQIRQRSKQGRAFFRVTCDGVNITFPDDPGYLFSDTPPGFISSSPTTSSQALTNCINYIANQTQKAAQGGGQGVAQTNKMSFIQMLVQKLITHIVILLKPFFVGITTPIPGISGSISNGYDGLITEVKNILQTQGRASESDQFTDIFPPSSCDILEWGNDMNSWTPDQKRKSLLITILCNMALNAAISFFVTYLLKEVKKFVAKYMANRAANKAQRKVDKLTQRFSNNKIDVARKNIKKAQRQAILISSVGSVTNASDGQFV